MHYKTPLLFLGLASTVFAQEFDNNDVPSQCRSVCQSMVDAARTCDQNFDGDRQEVDCICNTQGASTQLPECAACVRQFDPDRDDDDGDDEQNDVDEVMSSCGFTSTTFNGGAAASTGNAGTITSSASGSMITSVYTTTSTDFDDDPDDQDETRTLTRTTVFAADSTPTDAAGSASQSAGSATSNAGSAAGSGTSAAGSGAESATSAGDDASGAAATALPMLGAGAGALIAVFGLL